MEVKTSDVKQMKEDLVKCVDGIAVLREALLGPLAGKGGLLREFEVYKLKVNGIIWVLGIVCIAIVSLLFNLVENKLQ